MKKWTESGMLLFNPSCIHLFSVKVLSFSHSSLIRDFDAVVTLQHHHHFINSVYQSANQIFPTSERDDWWGIALAFSWTFSCLTKRPASVKLTTASWRNIQHVWSCLVVHDKHCLSVRPSAARHLMLLWLIKANRLKNCGCGLWNATCTLQQTHAGIQWHENCLQPG